MHQTNGVFEMHVKNPEGKELVWTIDLKKVRFTLPTPSSVWIMDKLTSLPRVLGS